MSAPILEITGLEKAFKEHEVLRGIDLCLEAGSLVGLVGNNGQGKTTLIKLIVGLLRPDAGQVCLAGQVAGFPRTRGQKRLLGYLPEAVQFYPRLTGAATLRFFAGLKGVGTDSVLPLLEQVGLADAADVPVSAFSKGMRQRLGLAQALLDRPPVLLLDEPTNGLDPDGIRDFYTILEGLRAEGIAILTASHMLAEIGPHLQRLALLRDGVFVRQGGVADLVAQAGLPTRIKVVLKTAHPATVAHLEGIGAHPSENGRPHSFELQCLPGDKLSLLEGILRQGAHIADVSVREPGLEDVFHHFQATRPGGAADEDGSTAGGPADKGGQP